VTHRPHPFVFSSDADRDFDIRCVLGIAVEGAAEPGEVIAATTGIAPHDHAGWMAAWRELGERARAIGDASLAAGATVSAAQAFLRASTYFGVAVNALSALADDSELPELFAAQSQTWESFVDQVDLDVERIAIPYEQRTLPGWFFRSPRAAAGPAPTLVAVNGSDGSLAALWGVVVAAALRRGYHVLVFDGPGQQSLLFTDGVPFRPDWEHVLTPVVDALIERDDVDPERLAVFGISQGGYWVPRALAFEHRFAAALVDPAVVDVSTSWTAHLPHSLLSLLAAGDDDKFDREMALGMKLSPTTARTWRFRARPYGTTGYAATLRAVQQYQLRDVAAQIRTPMLITAPEGEQFWPGQSAELARLAPDVSTVVPFTAAEGADGHCQPLARTLTAQRMFDWLDTRLASH